MGNFIAKVSGSGVSLEMFPEERPLVGEVASMPRDLGLPGGMAAQLEQGLGSQDGARTHLRERNLPPAPALVLSSGARGAPDAGARSVVRGTCVPGWERSGGGSVLILVLGETTGLDKQHRSVLKNQTPSVPEWHTGNWGEGGELSLASFVHQDISAFLPCFPSLSPAVSLSLALSFLTFLLLLPITY